jgi:hypothetical protein
MNMNIVYAYSLYAGKDSYEMYMIIISILIDSTEAYNILKLCINNKEIYNNSAIQITSLKQFYPELLLQCNKNSTNNNYSLILKYIDNYS